MTTNHTYTAEVAKVDEDQRLVFGWANVSVTADGKHVVDRQGDTIPITELEKAAYDYVLNSRDGGDMHTRTGVATMVESMVFTKDKIEKLNLPAGSVHEGWWVGFHVHDDAAWAEVKKGNRTQFSIHGTGRRREVEIPMEKAQLPEVVKIDTQRPIATIEKLTPGEKMQRQKAAEASARKRKAQPNKSDANDPGGFESGPQPPKGSDYRDGTWYNPDGSVFGYAPSEDSKIKPAEKASKKPTKKKPAGKRPSVKRSAARKLISEAKRRGLKVSSKGRTVTFTDKSGQSASFDIQ